MPTGRPDYWYGTALYFEETPTDGETARGPTSNWAFDHKADAAAHHEVFVPTDVKSMDLGKDEGTDDDCVISLYSKATTDATAKILRQATGTGHLIFYNYGTGDIYFWHGGANRLIIKCTGGVELIWDDTPTDGQVTKGVTSDWAFDHKGNVSAHHIKYLDSDAVTAMGAKGDANALHHDRYDDGDAVSAMGAKGDANALHHDRYTDAEAELACEAIVDDTPVNGATDQPVSSNWAFDHKADVDAHHALADIYTDRGNLSSWDWEIGNFTRDDTWRDLDISAFVGVQKCLVLLRANLQNDTVGEWFALRTNGLANDTNAAWSNIIAANVSQRFDMWVETDSNGIIEYRAKNGGTWATINLCVRGRLEVQS